jgi:hypothetical protein
MSPPKKRLVLLRVVVFLAGWLPEKLPWKTGFDVIKSWIISCSASSSRLPSRTYYYNRWLHEKKQHRGMRPSGFFYGSHLDRAFRTSESADFRGILRVRKFRTLKTLRTRTHGVFVSLRIYTVKKSINISQKKSEISKKKLNPFIPFINHMHRYLL